MERGFCKLCICGKVGQQRCSVCKLAYYCGATCQKRDWADHKGECKTIQTYNPKVEAPRMAALLRTSKQLRDHLAQITKNSGQLGVSLSFSNMHEMRIFAQPDCVCFTGQYITTLEPLADIPPLSITGYDPKTHFVVHLQIYIPGSNNDFMHMAEAFPKAQ